jgi:hypothetical protein
LADKAYSSRAIRDQLRRRGIRAVIPQPADQVANRKRRGSRGGRPPAFAQVTREEFDSYSQYRDFMRSRLLELDDALEAVDSQVALERVALSIRDELNAATAEMSSAARSRALNRCGAVLGTTSAVLAAVRPEALQGALASSATIAAGATGLWPTIQEEGLPLSLSEVEMVPRTRPLTCASPGNLIMCSDRGHRLARPVGKAPPEASGGPARPGPPDGRPLQAGAAGDDEEQGRVSIFTRPTATIVDLNRYRSP